MYELYHQQVIGSKKGGVTTKLLVKSENMGALKELQKHLGISIKFLHVVRNPYDNIATMLLRTLNKREDADFGEKVTGYFTVPRPTWRGAGHTPAFD